MIRRRTIVIASVLLLLTGVGNAQQGTGGGWADPKLTPIERVDAIGLAATWDPAAVEEMTDIIRRQS